MDSRDRNLTAHFLFRVRMGRIIAPILSLLPAMLTGCNSPANPAGVGAALPKVLTQKEVDERYAASFLAAARDFQSDGQPEYAVTTLEELIEKYPDSEAAKEPVHRRANKCKSSGYRVLSSRDFG